MDNTQYHFIYKTINLINNKEYIGIHSTYILDDGYLGSGYALLKAIKKYGESNFKKEILSFYNSREEALLAEKQLVTKEYIKNKNNYNLALGGKGNAGWTVWKGEHADRVRKILSEYSKGYHNPDFVKRWLPIYEALAPMACFYLCCTNLPNEFIKKVIKKRTNQSIKVYRLINYYSHRGYILKGEEIEWKDYFGSGLVPRQKATKTICNRINKNIQDSFIDYKAIQFNYLMDFSFIKALIIDNTISDSMIYNNLLNNNICNSVESRIKYYEYLGVIKEKEKIRINIRTRLPNSQRATGEKTIYEIIPIYNLLGIENSGEYNEYSINFDGNSFQSTRIQNTRYEEWRID